MGKQPVSAKGSRSATGRPGADGCSPAGKGHIDPRAGSRRGRLTQGALAAAVGLALTAFGAAPAAAISPINLDTTFSQRIDGATLNAAAGSAVHSAGPVNADNVPDTIVGDASGAGEADLVYGDANASHQVVNLGSLGARGYKMDSLNPSGGFNAGLSVANGGDVNGDGIPDQIIGAPGLTCAVTPVVYVVFGRRGAASNVDLSKIGTPGDTSGYRVTASPGNKNCMLGASVADAGDVNGDGIPDVIIGAPQADNNGLSGSGSVYVVYGQRGSVHDINLDSLTSAQGYRIDGAHAGDQLGSSVADVRDVNGDGTPDALIAAPEAPFNGHNGAGAAYVIFGRVHGATTIDLSLLTAAQGYEIGGPGPGAGLDESVAQAGDVNGDGIPDALIGEPLNGPGGVVYVVFATRSRSKPLDLAAIGTPGNTQGQRIVGNSGDDFGSAVANARDVNGDGIPDQLIGAPMISNGSEIGSVYVIFGSRDPGQRATAAIGTPGNTSGYVMKSSQASSAGEAVAPGADVNGDGFPDQQFAGPTNSGSHLGDGAVWTVFSSLALPDAVTGPATAVRAHAANLTGTVTPSAVTCQEAGTPTTFQFQLGRTKAYGLVAPAVPGSVGGGTAPRQVSETVKNLASKTKYHYRLTAQCADGAQRFGADRTFTTAVGRAH